MRDTLIEHGVDPSDVSFDACFKRLSTITETFVRVSEVILWHEGFRLS